MKTNQLSWDIIEIRSNRVVTEKTKYRFKSNRRVSYYYLFSILDRDDRFRFGR